MVWLLPTMSDKDSPNYVKEAVKSFLRLANNVTEQQNLESLMEHAIELADFVRGLDDLISAAVKYKEATAGRGDEEEAESELCQAASNLAPDDYIWEWRIETKDTLIKASLALDANIEEPISQQINPVRNRLEVNLKEAVSAYREARE